MEKQKPKKAVQISQFRKDKVQAVRFNRKLIDVLIENDLSVQRIFDMGVKFYLTKLGISPDTLDLTPSVKGRPPLAKSRKPNKPKADKKKTI